MRESFRGSNTAGGHSHVSIKETSGDHLRSTNELVYVRNEFTKHFHPNESQTYGQHYFRFGGDAIHSSSGGNGTEFGSAFTLGQFTFKTSGNSVNPAVPTSGLAIGDVASYQQSFGTLTYNIGEWLWSGFHELKSAAYALVLCEGTFSVPRLTNLRVPLLKVQSTTLSSIPLNRTVK